MILSGVKALDRRTALQNGQLLKFSDNAVYKIDKEIGRGGSCIVYNASYLNNIGEKRLVRIKECYPYSLSIKREENGSLTAEDVFLFDKEKEKFISAFSANNSLFDIDGLTNSVNNTIDIFRANETVYIVSTFVCGETLSEHKFGTLKECVSIVKSTAKVIAKIHESGSLYLDLKPENVIVIRETTELIRLFDFDSLVSEQVANDRVSFTKGYAAPELASGNIPDRKTDIYGLGALLFELIFGRNPDASDCGYNAVYDFDRMKFRGRYDDRLFPALSGFFSRTITNFPPDRYASANEAVNQLEVIEKYADLTIPFIVSSRVVAPKMLYGRTEERAFLSEWLGDESRKNISVFGMGGIGKSTLIRSFISDNRNKLDNVIYLYYKGSVIDTLNDDSGLFVNTIHRLSEESKEDYFSRKLRAVKEIVHGTKSLLVIDNLEDSEDEFLYEILNSEIRVILISRRQPIVSTDDVIELNEIGERSALYELFSHNLGKEIQPRDYKYLDNIIEKTAGHTLTLTIIARQISKSFLSVKAASILMDRYGLSGIGNEKIGFIKDYSVYYENISELISRLLKNEKLTECCTVILKILSALDCVGIDINEFQKLLSLKSKDDINYLIECGWINCEENNISVHPVIAEIIGKEKLSENEEDAVILFVDNLRNELNSENKLYFIGISESFIDNMNTSSIKSSETFGRFVLSFINALPNDCYDRKTEKAEMLLKNAQMLDRYEIIRLYDVVISGYEMLHDYEKEYLWLERAAIFAKAEKDDYITALCNYLFAGYYDVTDEFEKSEQYMDKALKYAERSSYRKSKELVADCVMSMTFVAVRSCKNRKNAASYIKRIGEMLRSDTALKDKLLCNYEIAKSWFYALYDRDMTMAEKSAKSALEAFIKSGRTAIEAIDNVIITYANILADIGLYDKSAYWLKRGIRLCDKRGSIIPYIRKKHDLLEYLLDVYELSDNLSAYRITEKEIKKLDEKMTDT